MDKWCRGFGSKEQDVLAILYWLNEMGRQMTDDLRLIDDSHEVDYEDQAHVPLNPLQKVFAANSEPFANASKDQRSN